MKSVMYKLGSLLCAFFVKFSLFWLHLLTWIFSDLFDVDVFGGLISLCFQLLPPFHDSLLLFTGPNRLIHVSVAVALIPVGEGLALVLAQLDKGLGLDEHVFHAVWLVQGAIKDIWSFLVVDDGPSNDVLIMLHKV